MRRIFVLMLVMVFMSSFLAIAPVGVSASTEAPEATVIAPVADTYVHGGNTSTAYGTEKYTVLKPKGGKKFPVYKFDLSGISANLSNTVEIESATLTLSASGGDTNLRTETEADMTTELYYIENDTWTESDLTYSTYTSNVTRGSVISDQVTIPKGTVYSNGNITFNYNITDAIKAEVAKSNDGYLSFVMDGTVETGKHVCFISKELAADSTYAQYAPKLTVTYKLKSFDPDNAVITPLADAYVGSGENEKALNYGGSPYLLYKPSVRLSYLKFDVSDVRSTLSSLSETTSIRTAKIRLYAVGADRIKTDGTTSQPIYTATTSSVDVRAYSVADDSWIEGTGDRNGSGDTATGISFDTKPDKGDGISEPVTIPAGTVYSANNPPYFELDITDALLAETDNTFSCVIDGDTYVNQTVYFFSSEYTDVAGLVPTLTVDYALKEDIATDITSTALTVDGEYIHGYSKDETVQSLISKIVIPEGATASVYDGSTLAANSAKIKQGMKLHITSKDTTKTENYTICNGELFVGSPVYSITGVQSDATYADTRIAVSIPVINYTDDEKKFSIIVARYNGETLEKAVVSEQTATARFNGNLTYTYTDGERAATVSYKVFVWEKDTLVPRAGSQLYSSAAAGKKVVVFGDSISAPNSGYVKLLADATSANITNAAVAGARIIAGNDGRPHDTYGINLQTIVSKLCNGDTDWSQQESYTNGGKESDDDKANIANYKNIDLANTDAVIIWMGTNDYGTDISLTDFEAAVKDVLDKLTAKNANLKIVLASPMYRAILDSGDAKNCYEYTNGIGKYLYEYCDVLENLSKDYANVTFLDMYNESGITKFSQEKYEYLGDGLHPKSGASDANKIIHALFAQKLASVLK